MMWGTILAMWGTGALVALTARQLNINTAGAGRAGAGWQADRRECMCAGCVDCSRRHTGGMAWGRVLPCRCCLWRRLAAADGPLSGSCRCCCFPLAAEEAPARLKQLFAPLGAALDSWLTPLRGSMSVTAVAGDAMRQDAQQSQLVKRLRTTLLSS